MNSDVTFELVFMNCHAFDSALNDLCNSHRLIYREELFSTVPGRTCGLLGCWVFYHILAKEGVFLFNEVDW